MAEYIEREEVALKVKRNLMPNVDVDGTVSVENAERYFLNLLAEQPAAEVVEVKHGEWKRCFEDWRKQIEGDECSVCGFQHYGTSISNYKYCPNCGAKMDVKEGAEE